MTHRSSNIYGVLNLDEVASRAPPQNDARLVEKLSIILMVKYAVKQSQHDQKKIQY